MDVVIYNSAAVRDLMPVEKYRIPDVPYALICSDVGRYGFDYNKIEFFRRLLFDFLSSNGIPVRVVSFQDPYDSRMDCIKVILSGASESEEELIVELISKFLRKT